MDPRAIEGLSADRKLEYARKEVHDRIDAAIRGTDSNSDARRALGFCAETRQIVCCQCMCRSAPGPGKSRYPFLDSKMHQRLFWQKASESLGGCVPSGVDACFVVGKDT